MALLSCVMTLKVQPPHFACLPQFLSILHSLKTQLDGRTPQWLSCRCCKRCCPLGHPGVEISQSHCRVIPNLPQEALNLPPDVWRFELQFEHPNHNMTTSCWHILAQMGHTWAPPRTGYGCHWAQYAPGAACARGVTRGAQRGKLWLGAEMFQKTSNWRWWRHGPWAFSDLLKYVNNAF